MTSYILDLRVNQAVLENEYKNFKGPVWAVIQVDGSSGPIYTPRYMTSDVIQFNFSIRLFLSISSLQNACLYLTFFALNQITNQDESIGVSKVYLKSFPVGKPRTFSFSFMNPKNTAMPTGKIMLTATFTTFFPQVPYSDGGWRQPTVVQNQQMQSSISSWAGYQSGQYSFTSAPM